MTDEIRDLLARDDYKHPRLVHDALRYAALGLRVIPLGKLSKHPRIERWQERASCDPHQIIHWLEMWPDSNIGIVTGGGLVVLDVDPRNGGDKSLKELRGRRKLPETATAWTGTGGHHYLFRVDPALRIGNINGLLPGIDIKGEGGQFVVEPSVHPKTRFEYVWLRTPQQGIADAPAWLVELILSAKHAKPARPTRERSIPLSLTRQGDEARLLADMIDKFPVEGYGQRNEKMHRAVASLVCRRYERGLVFRVLMGWYDHFFALGRIRTGREEAERLTLACIDSALRSTRLRPSVSEVDHLARIAQIELSPEQTEMIVEGVIQGGEIRLPTQRPGSPPPNIRVTYRQERLTRLCKTAKERAFVEAWTVYATYKTAIRESPLKATDDQIRQIVKDRRDFNLKKPETERYKRRYITRPDRPASRFELLVQTRKGRQGVPSEFQVTGLGLLLDPGAPQSTGESYQPPDAA